MLEPEKIISDVKRTDVVFFAKRAMQEFSYDTLKSVKSQELSIPPSSKRTYAARLCKLR